MKRLVASEDEYVSLMTNPALEAKKIRQRYKQESFEVLLKAILNDYSAVVEEHDFPGEVNAVCFRYNGVFVIGINKNREQGDKNFTVAHELGHYILSHSKTISLNLTRDHSLSQNCFSAMDMQANLFATELLMPEDAFKKEASRNPNIAGLARQFSVSIEVVMYRIRELNL